MISLPLAGDAPTDRLISTTPEVDRLLAAGAPVAMGISGGKDSCALGIATNEYLNRIGHTGPRVLIHADLGVVEWADSLPTCERLALRLGLELVKVARPQGDMLDRWEQRFRDNVARWESLSCVQLILPWSTPGMRFCTSELKVDQITRELSRRFPGREILNATGVRRAESEERKDTPVAEVCDKLASKTRQTSGLDWNPIVTWSTRDVFDFLAERTFPLHEAYTVFGADRVSCVYCIMASLAGHKAALRDPRTHAVARRMVDLELASTFGFQGSRWLADTAFEILTPEQRARIPEAKERAARRVAAEKKIPKGLLYTRGGWPQREPTTAEAELLAGVRAEVGAAIGLAPKFLDAAGVIGRYRELLALKAEKDAEKARKAAAKERRAAAKAAKAREEVLA